MTIKSPTPAKPAKVSLSQPRDWPNLFNSLIPLVIKAAFVLSPKPNPSEIPQAKAMIFLKAPHNSEPRRSEFV